MELNKDWYRLPELGREVSMSRATIWKYVNAGKLKATRYGGQWRVTKADWQQFMDDNNKPK